MLEGNVPLEGHEFDHKPKLIDLTDGDEQSFASLKSEVEKSDGIARVLVHPRFNPHDEIHPLTDEYLDHLEGFVNVPDTSAAPLIVFEEEGAVAQLDGVVGKLPHTFLVRTIPEDPLPATVELKSVLDKQLSQAEAFTLEQKAEKELYGKFKELGIRRIVIGGRYLFVREGSDGNYDYQTFIADTGASPSHIDWAKVQQYPKGCVGGVIVGSMREGIEVVISEAVSPGESPLFSDRHMGTGRFPREIS